MNTTVAPAPTPELLAQLRRRIAIAMKRHGVDDRDPRHVEAFIRHDKKYMEEGLGTIKPLELERMVLTAVDTLDTMSNAWTVYQEAAAHLEIPDYCYVAVFKDLKLI